MPTTVREMKTTEPFHLDHLPPKALTPAEVRVAHLVAEGFNSIEIGQKMNITHNSVKVYCSRIYVKLDLSGWGNQRVRLANWFRSSQFMTCEVCRYPIPDQMLACPRCTEEKGKKALRDYQLAPLRKIFEGEGEFTTRSISNQRHVQMFGAELAFCGVPVSGRDKKGRLAWNEDAAKAMCRQCHEQIEILMERACRTSAS